jgi:hypothetical protein
VQSNSLESRWHSRIAEPVEVPTETPDRGFRVGNWHLQKQVSIIERETGSDRCEDALSLPDKQIETNKYLINNCTWKWQ